MRTILAAACISAFALAGCETTDTDTGGGTETGGAVEGGGTPAPDSLEAQLAGLAPDEQRAYIAALTVRDGCLNNRSNIDGAVPAMIAAGFDAAEITNVPDMKAANSGSLRIYSDTNPARGERSLCAVDLPLESFDKFVAMVDAMIQQNFPGAERGSSGDNPAWKLPGTPETFIVADNAIQGPDGDATRMGAITFVAR